MNKIPLISLATSTLSALLIMSGIAFVSILVMRNDMRQQAQVILSIIVDIDNDIQMAWDLVTPLKVEPCSQDHRNLLRTALKKTYHIEDIAYVENDRIVCSALYDIHLVKALLTAPNYVGPLGAKIWVSSPWPFKDVDFNTALALRQNHLVVISDQGIQRFAAIPYDWQLLFTTPSFTTHVVGNPKLNSEPVRFSWIMGEHQVRECLPSLPYCIITQHAGWQYASENRLLALLTISVGYLFGWLIYTIIKRHLYSHTLPVKRVAKGLKHGYFFPLYQPIVRLSDNQIVGVEILARFRDELGDLFPDQFIPIISQTHQTWEFTEQLIHKSIVEMLQHKTPEEFSLSFNFFPQDIASGRASAIQSSKTVARWPGKIRIEITEDQDLDKAEAHGHLRDLEEAGFEIAIDDFGTGYSNLHALDVLHCSYLKVDRSFINDMEQGAVRASLIPHILEIAKQANLHVIAEGIENSAQAKLLTEMGVGFGQGYYFGRPMSADNLFAALFKSRD